MVEIAWESRHLVEIVRGAISGKTVRGAVYWWRLVKSYIGVSSSYLKVTGADGSTGRNLVSYLKVVGTDGNTRLVGYCLKEIAGCCYVGVY